MCLAKDDQKYFVDEEIFFLRKIVIVIMLAKVVTKVKFQHFLIYQYASFLKTFWVHLAPIDTIRGSSRWFAFLFFFGL